MTSGPLGPFYTIYHTFPCIICPPTFTKFWENFYITMHNTNPDFWHKSLISLLETVCCLPWIHLRIVNMWPRCSYYEVLNANLILSTSKNICSTFVNMESIWQHTFLGGMLPGLVRIPIIGVILDVGHPSSLSFLAARIHALSNMSVN